ncbi:MAG: GntR family transcriptional regulator [Paraburkholderia sp.]|jgi:DNA-binding GntR family transcriptional regulator|uniref:GntR family transcriptional regulator n=1 Tax=Burkholderiaceae TaxID=119060 RepID=UPI0010F4EC0A|nr:GntR family transcriptional regulator [Burkholderia sp. 4M9327F10]
MNSPDSTADASNFSPLQVDLARRISQRIVNGELQPGQHLSENALADEFQVSRTPVRKALQLIAGHGLADFRAQEGVFVTQTPPQSVPRFGDNITSDELCRQMLDDYAHERLPIAWTEKDLLERYGASRSVLTKALVQLASDSLIEKRKGHGWRFLPSMNTPDAMSESYRFRMIIECGAIREPGFRVDPVQLARLREAHQRLIDHPNEPLGAAELFALNAEFHEMIARFSGNRFILQAVQQQNQMRRLDEHVAHLRGPWHVVSCTEHLQIIDALEKGDFDWAAALMQRHLTQARTRSPQR